MHCVWKPCTWLLGLSVLSVLVGACGSAAQSQPTAAPSPTRTASAIATTVPLTVQAATTPTRVPTTQPTPTAVAFLTPEPRAAVPPPTVGRAGGQNSSGGSGVMDRLIESAKQDLVRRTGAAIGEISIIGAAPQEWRDS